MEIKNNRKLFYMLTDMGWGIPGEKKKNRGWQTVAPRNSILFYHTRCVLIYPYHPADVDRNLRPNGDEHSTYTQCVSGLLHIITSIYFLLSGNIYVLACCESTIPVHSPLTFQSVLLISAAIVYRGLLMPTRVWGIYFRS